MEGTALLVCQVKAGRQWRVLLLRDSRGAGGLHRKLAHGRPSLVAPLLLVEALEVERSAMLTREDELTTDERRPIERHLSVKEAAAALGVSGWQIYEAVAHRQLTVVAVHAQGADPHLAGRARCVGEGARTARPPCARARDGDRRAGAARAPVRHRAPVAAASEAAIVRWSRVTQPEEDPECPDVRMTV
jgi:hypothetical protein